MRDILFEEKVCYKSSLKPVDIEEKLLSLIKRKYETDDSFAGKVYPFKFSLTPILGNRQNFKITMLGNVRDGADTIVEITYTVSSVLRAFLYGEFALFLFITLIFKLANFNFIFSGVNHVDYLLVATSIGMIIMGKMIFIGQYYYYSKFITRFLSLEMI